MAAGWPRSAPFRCSSLGNIIVPLYVLPLFNKFEPVTGSLEERLRRARRAIRRRRRGDTADGHEPQTRKANAFVTGIGTTHRIVLGDTLIDALSRERDRVRGRARARALRQQGHVAHDRARRSAEPRAVPDRERASRYASGGAARAALLVVRLYARDAGRNAGTSPAAVCILALARMGRRPVCARGHLRRSGEAPRRSAVCAIRISPTKIRRRGTSSSSPRIRRCERESRRSRRTKPSTAERPRPQPGARSVFARDECARRSSSRSSPNRPKPSANASCLWMDSSLTWLAKMNVSSPRSRIHVERPREDSAHDVFDELRDCGAPC